MRRRFITSLVLLFAIFVAGMFLTLRSLRSSSEELERLIRLYQIEDLRQELEARIHLTLEDLKVSETVFANNLDDVIGHVTELDRSAQGCFDCHHEPAQELLLIDISQRLQAYKKKFSHYITAIGDPDFRRQQQLEASAIGQELSFQLSRIRHRTTTRLQENTEQARRQVQQSWRSLSFTVALTLLCATLLAVFMTRQTTAAIGTMVSAAQQISGGALGVRVSHRERGEVGQMLEAFNNMSTSLAERDLLVRQRTDEILETRDIALITLARLAECRDTDTGHHLERIAAYSRCLAEGLRRGSYADQVDDEFVEQLFKTSPLHDIGKVGIPDAILRKRSELTENERETMSDHTLIGGDTLQSVVDEFENRGFLRMAIEIAYCHHEQWDGSGYPRGLRGAAIPLSARIVALADAYDAITSWRPYQGALDHEEAVRRILLDRGSHFDPVVVDAFAAVEGDILRTKREFESGGLKPHYWIHGEEDEETSGRVIPFGSLRRR